MKRKQPANRRPPTASGYQKSEKSGQEKSIRQTENHPARRDFKKNLTAESRKTSTAVVFGVLPVLELLKARTRPVEKILIAEGVHEHRVGKIITLVKELRIPFQKIPRSKFFDYVDSEANHQGVLALTAAADYIGAEKLFDEIVSKSHTAEKALVVVLDGVEDPRNLGAILRTVECAGADGVFIPERRAAGLTETVAKTAAGATEYVKTAKVVNVADLIEDLKTQNVWTVGASADAKLSYTDWDWTQNCALVMGGEGKGLRRLVAEKCDVLVKIPMRGSIQSLNVSAAAAVILFEARRQREQIAAQTIGELEN